MPYSKKRKIKQIINLKINKLNNKKWSKNCIILMVNSVCIIGLILYKKSDLIFIKVYYILVINDLIKEKLYLISCIKMMQIKSQIVVFKIIKCIK